jgi:hypothetical protein
MTVFAVPAADRLSRPPMRGPDRGMLHHRIRKGQFDLTSVLLKEANSPSIWMAVLSAH